MPNPSQRTGRSLRQLIAGGTLAGLAGYGLCSLIPGEAATRAAPQWLTRPAIVSSLPLRHGPSPVYIGSASASDSSGKATSLVIPYSPRAGNTLIIVVAQKRGTGLYHSIAATDNGGTAYYQSQPFNGSGGHRQICLLYTAPGAVKSGVTQITIGLTERSKVAAVVAEYSGVNAFGLGTDDAGNSAAPSQEATVLDDGDIMVMGVFSNGVGTFSSSAGNLRNSAITSRGSARSNVGAALADITSSSARDSVKLTVHTTISEYWMTSLMELKGTSPSSMGGHFVQGTVCAYQSGDSNGTLWGLFSKPTKPGNLIVVASLFTASGTSPTIKDYLNRWTRSNGPVRVGSRYAAMWYALNSISTDFVIAQYRFDGRVELYSAEYDVQPGTAFDGAASASGLSSSLDSGAAEIRGTRGLLIAFGTDGNVSNRLTSGAGFLSRIQDQSYISDLFEDRLVKGAGSYHGIEGNSNSGEWGMMVAAFSMPRDNL
jgi:hypothetical protein